MSCDIRYIDGLNVSSYSDPPVDSENYDLYKDYNRSIKRPSTTGNSRFIISDTDVSASRSTVTYGGVVYYSVKMTLSPRIHSWTEDSSKDIDMEVVIEHIDEDNNRLYICIPVEIVNGGTPGPLDTIITNTIGSIPTPTSFTGLVANSEFTTYDRDQTPSDCAYDIRVIIYGYNAKLSITTSTLNSIYEVTSLGVELTGQSSNDYGFSIVDEEYKGIFIETGNLNYFKIIGLAETPNEIYIECQPTGASSEEVMIETSINIPSTKGFFMQTLKTMIAYIIPTVFATLLITFFLRQIVQVYLDPRIKRLESLQTK
jgi:hypothetical protein